MNWYYKSNPSWLIARRDFLTASCVADILNKKKPPSDESIRTALIKKWFENNSNYEPDTYCSNDAARGHVMEPYAVKEYVHITGNNVWHYDDLIVANGNIAFSPDAIDVDYQADSIVVDSKDIDINHIVEVKCYANNNHVNALFADDKDISERWQVAFAMAVCDTIQKASIIFYNPSCVIPYKIVDYRREDLDNELKEINRVIDIWNKVCDECNTMVEIHSFTDISIIFNEKDINRWNREDQI